MEGGSTEAVKDVQLCVVADGRAIPFWAENKHVGPPLSPSSSLHPTPPLAAHDAVVPTDLKWLRSQRVGPRAVPLLAGAMLLKKHLNQRTPET